MNRSRTLGWRFKIVESGELSTNWTHYNSKTIYVLMDMCTCVLSISINYSRFIVFVNEKLIKYSETLNQTYNFEKCSYFYTNTFKLKLNLFQIWWKHSNDWWWIQHWCATILPQYSTSWVTCLTGYSLSLIHI